MSYNLLTVEKGSEKKYPQNKFFNQIVASSDEKEESEWKDLNDNIDSKFFDYHLPIDGNIVPINKRLFVPREYQNDVKNNKWIVPIDTRRENMLKKLQNLNYYDKEGKRTKKKLPEPAVFDNPPAKNKKKFLKDFNLILGYKNSFHQKDEDDIDYMPSDIKNIQLNYIISYILLSKAKCCITLNHTRILFYRLKEYQKKLITISLQNGHIYVNDKYYKFSNSKI